MASGKYFYSEHTEQLAAAYLQQLQNKTVQPGKYLAQISKETPFAQMSSIAFIAALMNTRKARIFAESEPFLDGKYDWNATETAILGAISYSTSNTRAYNNGHHDAPKTLIRPH
ncbi:MAG: hypothetical protein NTU48_01505 [Legionellales bacterium]|nr:hypothetical protein [Legionellales bacterium]